MTITVAQMIAKLQTLPQNLEVEVTMNMEYQRLMDLDDFEVWTDKDEAGVVRKILMIGDVNYS
jgi:hypothetical protein